MLTQFGQTPETTIVQRAIITGGAGFVGANLTRRLQQLHPNADLLVIDDLRGGHFANLCDERPGDFGPYRGRFDARSVTEIDWAELIREERPDALFHLASITDTRVMDQREMMLDNVPPFEAMVDACRDAGVRLVWSSSAATYGTTANGATPERRPFKLDDAGEPANVYGFSKWIMENVHRRAVAADPTFHIVGLRYFNVYGPGESYKGSMASMIHQLTCQVLDGKRPRIFTDGTQARDQVAVHDVVDATIAGASPDSTPGIYNLGCGQATSFNQIVAYINEALGTSHEAEFFDNPYPFYQDYTCADISETCAKLNWSPRHEPRESIVAYARWLASRAGVDTLVTNPS